MLRFVFLVFFLFITALSPIKSGYAETEASPQPQSEGSIYDRASNDQLKEAQDYYDSCRASSLNLQKNCKCAATAFLEKRMELGAEASIEEISTANINKCMKDPKLSEIDTDNLDMTTVTEAQKQEALSVYAMCKDNYHLRTRFECDCYAAKFLDHRIKLGPVVSKDTIYEKLAFVCKNVVTQVGQQYQSCFDRTRVLGTNGIPVKEYCECYARKWGEVFKAHEGARTIKTDKNMSVYAYEYCANRHNYQ